MDTMQQPQWFRLKSIKSGPLFRIAIPSWHIGKSNRTPTQVTSEKLTRDEIATLFEAELDQHDKCAACKWLPQFMRCR